MVVSKFKVVTTKGPQHSRFIEKIQGGSVIEKDVSKSDNYDRYVFNVLLLLWHGWSAQKPVPFCTPLTPPTAAPSFTFHRPQKCRADNELSNQVHDLVVPLSRFFCCFFQERGVMKSWYLAPRLRRKALSVVPRLGRQLNDQCCKRGPRFLWAECAFNKMACRLEHWRLSMRSSAT